MQSPLTEQPNALPPLALRELGALLVRHYGMHEGHYDVSFEIMMGSGRFKDDQGSPMPGAFIGIRQVGLIRVQKATENTIDAALVNPLDSSAKRPTAAKRTRPKA